MSKIIIVGAGIAGLLAATELVAAGHELLVIDKGRGVGGRMSNRRLTTDGSARSDHGAQYFTARDARFLAYVERWQEAGIVQQWSDGFHSEDGTPHFNGDARYVGVGGMTAIAKALAAPLNVRTGIRVASISHRAGRIVLKTAAAATFSADSLILTPPVPQSLELLAAGNVVLSAENHAALAKVSYDPCFALMVHLNGPSNVPAPGGVWPLKKEPISWIADNFQKGVSQQHTLTIHAGPDFTRTHYNADRDDVTQQLLAAADRWLGANIVSTQLQRWRYSVPTTLHPDRVLFTSDPAPIAFAGDAFAGPRVEGAALSGLAAADALADRLL